MSLTHISLFTGIGGIDLAAEWAGFKTVLMVEKDSYCQKVLRKHWPDVPIMEDIFDVTKERIQGETKQRAIDIISGGFPCQDVSTSGLRQGIGGSTRSGLWYEFARIISEIKPRWVVVENVSGLLSIDNGGGFGTILGDLAKSGYDAQWGSISLAQLGGWHKRERLFLVAHANGIRPLASEFFQTIYSKECGRAWPPITINGILDLNGYTYPILAGDLRVAHGIPSRVDRLRALGNAVVPQQIYPILKAIADIERSNQ